MSRPKFRKIYFPGLISLVCLPLMCIGYLVQNNTFYKLQGMPITWCDAKLFKEFHIATFRKYEAINISGNSSSDVAEINKINSRLKQLLIKDDVKNGIKVIFGDKSNYAEFINVLDICFLNSDKGLVFAPYGNKLFIGHVRLQSSPASSVHHLYNDVIIQKASVREPDFSSEQNIKTFFSKLSRLAEKYWAPILAFTIMLVFAFSKRRRYLNLRNFHLVSD
jgi:hypothetical protein